MVREGKSCFSLFDFLLFVYFIYLFYAYLIFLFYFFSSTHSLFSLFDFHSCMFFIIFSLFFCFFTFSPKIFFFPNLLHFHYLFMPPKNPTLYSFFLFFMSRNQLSCLGNEKVMLVTYPFLNYCHTH